ncbi:MAG: TIGR00701 family protein [Bdellovibrionaceae bacterium]|nr:TIGR00701 family protein [Pseudobdellovibrionaceae bacterium]
MWLLAFKSLHLIAMVAWFAGLFYMFRLFVYHTENKNKPDVVTTLKVMELRLLKYITVPAMIVTLVGGVAMLIYNPGYLSQTWIHIKLGLISMLVGYTYFIGRVRKRYEVDDVYLTSKQCRLWNEFPTPILVAIILLAVYRP